MRSLATMRFGGFRFDSMSSCVSTIMFRASSGEPPNHVLHAALDLCVSRCESEFESETR